MNPDSLQLAGGYYIAVTKHDEPAKRRVKSLYLDLATTDPTTTLAPRSKPCGTCSYSYLVTFRTVDATTGPAPPTQLFIFPSRSRKYSFHISGNAATRKARRTDAASLALYLFSA